MVLIHRERYTDQQIIGSYSQRKIERSKDNWFLCIEKDRLTDDWFLVTEKDRSRDNWLFTEIDQEIIGCYSQRKIERSTGNWFLFIEKDR